MHYYVSKLSFLVILSSTLTGFYTYCKFLKESSEEQSSFFETLSVKEKSTSTEPGEIADFGNLKRGQQLQKFIGHTGGVISAAFNPDGRTVLTGSWDDTVRLWDVSTGKQLQVLKGHT